MRFGVLLPGVTDLQEPPELRVIRDPQESEVSETAELTEVLEIQGVPEVTEVLEAVVVAPAISGVREAAVVALEA